MKKIKFYIMCKGITNNKVFKREVSGYQVDELTGVYWNDGEWIIMDLKTGLECCRDNTMKEAVAKYQEPEFNSRVIVVRNGKYYFNAITTFEKAEVMKDEKVC